MTDSNPFVFYQLNNPGQLALLPDPNHIRSNSKPSAKHILCRTEMTALSPGTELSAYRGDPPLRPQAKVYPRLQGYCSIATIIACDTDTPVHLKVGDRVITQQSHRSGYMIPHQQVLAKVPDGLDAATASVTYLFHLGYAAFLKSGAVQGDRAAIVGLGTLGLTTAALFKHGGVAMTGFSNHSPPDAIIQDFGLREVQPKTIGKNANRFDHVVVTTNGWGDWRMALELCAPGATITALSFPGRGQEAPDFNPLDSRYFYDKQLKIQSCGYMPSGASEIRRDQPRSLRYNIQFLINAIADGSLPAKALIKGIRPYSELGDIYEEMLAGDRSALTNVLEWTTAGE